MTEPTTKPAQPEVNPALLEEIKAPVIAGVPANRPSTSAAKELELSAHLTQEYVTSGRLSWYTTLIQSLPTYIDDITAQFGADLYERMMQDAQVASCVNALKTAVLEGELNLVPFDMPEDADQATIDKAKEVFDFCKRVLDDLETPLEDVLWNMLDALFQGNKVAELVWILAYEEGSTLPKLEIRAIHTKPQDSVSFVVDTFNNVLGLLPAVPGSGAVSGSALLLSDELNKYLVPREKFMVLSFRPKDNDPRGTSLLRAAYYVWWLKQQLFPEWLKYLAQFATPSLVGYTAENANSEVVTDSDGNPTFDGSGNPIVVTPEEKLLQVLVQVRNGSAAALPFGSKVDDLAILGDGGKSFLDAFAQLDHWIAKAVLNQTLATEEGAHQARAAAQVHMDVLGLLIRSIKNSVCRMMRRDVLHPLVEYNFGAVGASVMPDCTLGEDDEADFSTTAAAITALFNAKYISPTQLAYTDTLLGLPPRPAEEIQAMIDQIETGRQMAQAAATALGNNNPGGAKEEDANPPEQGNKPPFGKKEAPPVGKPAPGEEDAK